ncbi:MAG: hypothetical protein D6714_01010 [Bacteroidetes bacterium]|nr:MAG: hypothetical protein D6714_01010 [Bacteroidota bacterium]
MIFKFFFEKIVRPFSRIKPTGASLFFTPKRTKIKTRGPAFISQKNVSRLIHASKDTGLSPARDIYFLNAKMRRAGAPFHFGILLSLAVKNTLNKINT